MTVQLRNFSLLLKSLNPSTAARLRTGSRMQKCAASGRRTESQHDEKCCGGKYTTGSVHAQYHFCSSLVLSPNCPFCPAARETLTHFVCICPQLREASTAAHIQGRNKTCSSLTKLISKKCTIHEQIPMGKTGLRLELVSAACMEVAEAQFPEHHTDMVSVDNQTKGWCHGP
jgi:hypothetical protein